MGWEGNLRKGKGKGREEGEWGANKVLLMLNLSFCSEFYVMNVVGGLGWVRLGVFSRSVFVYGDKPKKAKEQIEEYIDMI
jgi:hypothetical protein